MSTDLPSTKSALFEELERTLSYFEPMSLELIYLDLDAAFLKLHPSLTIEDLSETLQEMKDQKKIKENIVKEHKYYLKLYPKRSFLTKLISYFKR